MTLIAQVNETTTLPGLKFFKNPNSVCLEIHDKGNMRCQFAYSMSQLLSVLDPEVMESLLAA